MTNSQHAAQYVERECVHERDGEKESVPWLVCSIRLFFVRFDWGFSSFLLGFLLLPIVTLQNFIVVFSMSAAGTSAAAAAAQSDDEADFDDIPDLRAELEQVMALEDTEAPARDEDGNQEMSMCPAGQCVSFFVVFVVSQKTE